MIAVLDFYIRANSVVAQMHHRLQIDGLRVDMQPRIEPTEERPHVRSLRDVERPNPFPKASLAQRKPHSPAEWLIPSVNWNLEAPANEELTLVDDAVIAT